MYTYIYTYMHIYYIYGLAPQNNNFLWGRIFLFSFELLQFTTQDRPEFESASGASESPALERWTLPALKPLPPPPLPIQLPLNSLLSQEEGEEALLVLKVVRW